MDRRALLGLIPAAVVWPGLARAEDFAGFLARLQARAAAVGIPEQVIDAAMAGLAPNEEVLKLDRHQPEFTLTWAQYSTRVLNATRVAQGQAKAQSAANLLAAVTSRFGVASGALLGIWGIETNYGTSQGNFDVVDALTTLAWDRNSSYFSNQVIAALRIIANGDAPAQKLIGSYAGAMGQPQFMPSVYLSTAVSFTGSGQADIWNSDADTLASMGNYLAKAGWVAGMPSSEQVVAPVYVDMNFTGRENVESIGYWTSRGVQRLPGAPVLPNSTPAALLLPDGKGGQAFFVYQNFNVIRRYNASDYYALAVGELGRMALNA